MHTVREPIFVKGAKNCCVLGPGPLGSGSRFGLRGEKLLYTRSGTVGLRELVSPKGQKLFYTRSGTVGLRESVLPKRQKLLHTRSGTVRLPGQVSPKGREIVACTVRDRWAPGAGLS